MACKERNQSLLVRVFELCANRHDERFFGLSGGGCNKERKDEEEEDIKLKKHKSSNRECNCSDKVSLLSSKMRTLAGFIADRACEILLYRFVTVPRLFPEPPPC